MPGFVDVSNMSDLEIKRLGQMDEDDVDFQPRRSFKRNPYGYTDSNRPARPASAKYSVSDVWAAACSVFQRSKRPPNVLESNRGLSVRPPTVPNSRVPRQLSALPITRSP